MKYLFFLLAVFLSSCETKTTQCKIHSHSTMFSTGCSCTSYSTVMICDDGWIRTETDLKYYVTPIGVTIKYEYSILKKFW